MADEQPAQKGRGKGFASMTPQRRAEMARKGGKTAHERGVAYKWTSEAASEAGKKGGSVTGKSKRTRRQQP